MATLAQNRSSTACFAIMLRRVANVYRENIDAQPIEAISDEFDVSYRTAARYVQLCRSDEFQLLPKTRKGKREA